MKEAESSRKKEEAKRLLRAMSRVSSSYIEEAGHLDESAGMQREAARQGQTGNKKKTIISFSKLRKRAGIAAAVAACFAAAMIGIRIISQSRIADVEPASSTYDLSSNPYEQVSSMSEAESITGFRMEIPEAKAPYPNVLIHVIGKTMIEVSYCSQDETETGYSIRKAAGSDDISGDYTDYPDQTTADAGGISLTLKGENGTWSVATWTSGGYSYAISAGEHPLTTKEMLLIAESVR